MTFSSKTTLTDKEKSGTTEFELEFPALFHDMFYGKKKKTSPLALFSKKSKNYHQIVIILSFYQDCGANY